MIGVGSSGSWIKLSVPRGELVNTVNLLDLEYVFTVEVMIDAQCH